VQGVSVDIWKENFLENLEVEISEDATIGE